MRIGMDAMDRFFAKFASATAHAAGTPTAFLLCILLVVGWALSGPMFGFSETWQLVINTGTTIITFLMVFLIQNTQNRDGQAVQTKLDELIRATATAHNEYMGIEKLTDKELEALHASCEQAAHHANEKLKRTQAERDARQGRRNGPVAAKTDAPKPPQRRTASKPRASRAKAAG
jgi:low affinity Fe/Cu permease